MVTVSIFRVMLTTLAIGVTPVIAQETKAPTVSVQSLTQQGWEIAATTTRNETRPGLPPYEHLARVVSITTYTLTHGDQTTICEIVYDSQRDTIEEQCAESSP